MCRLNLGRVFAAQGRVEEASESLSTAREVLTNHFGEGNPNLNGLLDLIQASERSI
jgi:hypothetical protein